MVTLIRCTTLIYLYQSNKQPLMNILTKICLLFKLSTMPKTSYIYQKYLIVASLTIITINAFKTLIYFVHQKS